eukprot:g18539.t1
MLAHYHVNGFWTFLTPRSSEGRHCAGDEIWWRDGGKSSGQSHCIPGPDFSMDHEVKSGGSDVVLQAASEQEIPRYNLAVGNNHKNFPCPLWVDREHTGTAVRSVWRPSRRPELPGPFRNVCLRVKPLKRAKYCRLKSSYAALCDEDGHMGDHVYLHDSGNELRITCFGHLEEKGLGVGFTNARRDVLRPQPGDVLRPRPRKPTRALRLFETAFWPARYSGDFFKTGEVKAVFLSTTTTEEEEERPRQFPFAPWLSLVDTDLGAAEDDEDEDELEDYKHYSRGLFTMVDSGEQLAYYRSTFALSASQRAEFCEQQKQHAHDDVEVPARRSSYLRHSVLGEADHAWFEADDPQLEANTFFFRILDPLRAHCGRVLLVGLGLTLLANVLLVSFLAPVLLVALTLAVAAFWACYFYVNVGFFYVTELLAPVGIGGRCTEVRFDQGGSWSGWLHVHFCTRFGGAEVYLLVFLLVFLFTTGLLVRVCRYQRSGTLALQLLKASSKVISRVPGLLFLAPVVAVCTGVFCFVLYACCLASLYLAPDGYFLGGDRAPFFLADLMSTVLHGLLNVLVAPLALLLPEGVLEKYVSDSTRVFLLRTLAVLLTLGSYEWLRSFLHGVTTTAVAEGVIEWFYAADGTRETTVQNTTVQMKTTPAALKNAPMMDHSPFFDEERRRQSVGRTKSTCSPLSFFSFFSTWLRTLFAFPGTIATGAFFHSFYWMLQLVLFAVDYGFLGFYGPAELLGARAAAGAGTASAGSRGTSVILLALALVPVSKIYVYVALDRNSSFSSACKTVLAVIGKHPSQWVLLQAVVGCLTLICFAGVLVVVVVFVRATDAFGGEEVDPLVPTIACLLLAFCFTWEILKVYATAVDALYVCCLRTWEEHTSTGTRLALDKKDLVELRKALEDVFRGEAQAAHMRREHPRLKGGLWSDAPKIEEGNGRPRVRIF